MAKRRKLAWVIAAVGAAAFLAACSAGNFGEPISAAKETPIDNLLNDPAAFQGKDVVVSGQIATVDGDGKGFNLDTGRSRLLYVKAAGDFKIPAMSKYHLATVEGTVDFDAKAGTATILAKGVRIK